MKSKKLYGTPIIELTALSSLDVITTSGAYVPPSQGGSGSDPGIVIPPVSGGDNDGIYDLPWT
jgi:hypothetical protein